MSHNPITATEENHWTEVIKPTSNLFDLKLKELWRYRDLIALFVRRDFVAQYKQTILGPTWHFIQPVLTTLMFTIVFSRIAGISTDGVPPLLFYVTGITIWNYFSACLTKTATTFTANANIFGKVYFPRLVVPVSTVISGLLQFAIQLIPLLLILAYYAIFTEYTPQLNAWLLAVPYLVFLMAILGLGLGVFISALTTKYRDLVIVIGFGVQLLMYVSAIIHPLSAVSPEAQKWLLLNPVVPVIEGFRFALLGSGTFNLPMLGYTTAVTAVIFLVGVILFNKIEKSFMDTV